MMSGELPEMTRIGDAVRLVLVAIITVIICDEW